MVKNGKDCLKTVYWMVKEYLPNYTVIKLREHGWMINMCNWIEIYI